MNLIQRIDQWGVRHPNRAAHISGSQVLSWETLRRRSNTLAAALAKTLPANGSPVAIVGHKEPEMLIGFLGSAKSGHPYVPIDISIPEDRRKRIVAVSGASLVLSPAEIAALTQADAPAPAPELAVRQEQPYYILFTSGSTGEPKGVVITSACLEAFINWTLDEQKPREAQEVFLNQAPFSFDLSVMDLYSSLATGGTLFSLSSQHMSNLRLLFQALAESNITFWVSTPSFASMCLTEKTFAAPMLPALRKLWFCGETLPWELASTLITRFPDAQVWNTYGPTEATVATTSIQITRQVLEQFPSLPVGFTMPGTTIYCAAEDGTELPDGQRGELVIVGPNVSPGYLGRSDLTAEKFKTHNGIRAYRTGDLGRVERRLVFFDGRADNQVKLHGHRIELGDIEENLRRLPGIRDVVVLPVSKKGKVDSLAAIVVLSNPLIKDEFEESQAIKAQLGGHVPPYMIPRKFKFVQAFPTTPNGKADRQKLAQLLT